MSLTVDDVYKVLSLAKKHGLYLVNINQKDRHDEVKNNLINSMHDDKLFDTGEREKIAELMLRYERSSDPVVESFFVKNC